MLSFFRRLFKMNRYFIFSFTWESSTHKGAGNADETTSDGQYLNLYQIQKEIKDYLIKNGLGDPAVKIDFFVEVSKADWTDCRRGSEDGHFTRL